MPLSVPPNVPGRILLRELLQREIKAHAETRELLKRIEQAYSSFVPREFLSFLNVPNILDIKLGTHVEMEVTVLFSDIRDFTALSETMTPAENFRFVNKYLSYMEPAIAKHKGIIDKYIGDAIMGLFNTSPDDAILGALEMLRVLEMLNESREAAGYYPIRIGIGLNTGMAMLGTVGSEHRMQGTVISDAVNLTARLEELTKAYGVSILIGESTYFRLENPERFCIRFLDRVKVKGKTRPQSIYEIFDDNPEPLRSAKRAMLDTFEEALAHYHTGELDTAWELLTECVEIAPDDIPARLYLERCETSLRTGIKDTEDDLETVEWSAEYSIGIDEIDYQHAGLLQVINLLAEHIRGEATTDVTEILTFLREYVDDHFVNEERLMERYAYPFVTEHTIQHNIFKQRFARLEKEILAREKGHMYLFFRVRVFLLDWFGTHTSKNDRHLGRFLLHAMATEARQAAGGA